MKSPYIEEVMVYEHETDSTTEKAHAIMHPCEESLDDYNRGDCTRPMTETDVESLIRTEVLSACKNLADYNRVKKFTIRGR